MSGLEVENSAVSACEGATASEYLAALEPTEEDYFLGGGNVEHFAIHLFGIENEGFVNACGDGVVGLNAPDPLSFAVSPLKRAGGSHKLLEYLGIVSRVKNDKSHT